MSKKTANTLFIDSSMNRFYQHQFGIIASYKELGHLITGQIKHAHAFRQIEKVRELSRLLLNIPIREYRIIANYYLIWCEYRESRYETEGLERIIEQTQTYKAKALFSRGAVEWYRGNSEAAFSFYHEALKTVRCVSDYIVLSRSIAVLKSTEGLHRSALRDLENLLPLIKHAEPLEYYDYLNSYAVELSEAGRKQEARNIIKHVLASPFAYAYPEWQETANALRGSSRSIVAIAASQPAPHNVLLMPAIEQGRSAVTPHEPARVVSLQKWKKTVKGETSNGRKNTDEMSHKDIFFEIMHEMAKQTTTRKQLQRIYDATLKILSEQDPPKIDDPIN